MTTVKMEEIDHKAAVMNGSAHGNILAEDACLPALIIKQKALDNNIQWMQSYADACHVSLAPHGKTTMTPEIFKRQVAAGAWAIGVGSAYQAKIAAEAGINRIIIANQLIGKANMTVISSLKLNSDTVIYCCVDSVENARQLSEHFVRQGQTINVLLELGVAGGRCGCRTSEQARQLADEICSLPGLHLSGIEFYEGVIHGPDMQADIVRIEAFLNWVFEFTRDLMANKTVADNQEFLLTGAGTVWYDIVAQQMHSSGLPDNVRYVIRPGCYITHDKGIYQQSQESLRQRDTLARQIGGDLVSALELCAFVQSLPEPGLAIIGFGKRDAAFDSGLPQPVAHYRQGTSIPLIANSLRTVDIMDQHAMLHYTTESTLQVGDILIFSTSHPCLSFDKWRKIFLVDDDYAILETVDTGF